MTDNMPQLPEFEQLRNLARDDPEAFEAKRQELIEAVLARVPEGRRHRMRGLQWRIEQVRRRSGTPMAACVNLSRMMWDSVAGENGLLDALNNGPSARPEAAEKAPVLTFRRKHH